MNTGAGWRRWRKRRAWRSRPWPWHVKRVRYYDDEGRRCTAFKTRWWARLIVPNQSSPGPYFETLATKRRWFRPSLSAEVERLRDALRMIASQYETGLSLWTARDAHIWTVANETLGDGEMCRCGHVRRHHLDDVRETRCDLDRLCGCPGYAPQSEETSRGEAPASPDGPIGPLCDEDGS